VRAVGHPGRWILGLAFTATLLLGVAPAGAVVFNVTTPADTAVGAPAGCTTQSCSLRQALTAADSSSEVDTVNVPAGTYSLTSGGLTRSSSQLDAVQGAGANSTIISAGGLSRVLNLNGEARLIVRGVTIRDGVAPQGGTGGNILVGNTALLLLDHVRVTAGTATTGGGIGGSGALGIVAVYSLIDNNTSTSQGGGVHADGQTASNTQVQIQNSTLAFNKASSGGGLYLQNVINGNLTLTGVTVAYNQATSTTGGGIFIPQASGPTASSLTGNIIANNTGNISQFAVVIGPSNCGGRTPIATDGGGNLETGADCGLALAGRQNSDPQLATTLQDAGSQTPVLPIRATSPAVDLATCPTTAVTDQRDVSRPQGLACDAGAFEYQAPPPAPPPVDTPPPPTTTTAQQTPPPPPPVPVLKRSVVISRLSGKVLVRVPGSSMYVDVTALKSIPLGSIVDATNGRVTLTSAADKNGKTSTAVFYDGKFRVTQTGTDPVITVLTLVGPVPPCPTTKKRSAGKGKARTNAVADAGATKKKTKPRRLWGDGKGTFQTKGAYSSATVRGTKWLVQDDCKLTLTRVAHGVVTVADFVKKKSIRLAAPHTYVARAKR
jgi:hypothetical protein